MTDLLPCPFCGSDTAQLTEAMGEAWIRCPSCDASAGMSSHAPLAIKNWNARATKRHVISGSDAAEDDDL